MKKIFSSILIFAVLLSSVFCVNANAAYDKEMEEMELYSECVYLVSMDNGEVIFDKHGGKQTAPASLTKIITSIVVLENCPDLNAVVTVPESCITELSGTGSSLGGLKAGETLSVYNLLCYLLLKSANEAATTLADYVAGGDRAKFIGMMNKVAEDLGCKDSHFVNPHGLDDENQYVSARDMAKFMTRALEFPEFKEIVSRSTYTVPETNMNKEHLIISTNYMLNSAYKEYYCKYVKGGKTGTTSNAGRCMVAYASKDGYNYLCVTLNSTFYDVDKDGVNENGAFLDCKEMIEWTFDNIELVPICNTNQIVAQLPVKYAKNTDFVTLSPEETVYSLVPSGTDASSLLVEIVEGSAPEILKAPVKKGDTVCRGRVLYAGNVIKEINLISNTDAKMSIFSLIGSIAKTIFSSWIFRIIALAVIVALVILIIRKRNSGSGNTKKKKYQVLNYNDFVKTNR